MQYPRSPGIPWLRPLRILRPRVTSEALRPGFESHFEAEVCLGVLTVAASLVAGLLGPIAIALYAVTLSLPVWAAWWWLKRRG